MRTAALVLALAPCVSAYGLRKPVDAIATNATEVMELTPHQFVKVELGPFDSSSEACDYCLGSYTKKGNPPAGPVAPFCVCMAYHDSGIGGWNMFCATPPSSAGYVGSEENGRSQGCRCKPRDMEAMGKTTCTPL